MSDKEILAARAKWTAPAAKPKEAEEAPAAAAEDSVPVAKPKRTLSEEQKAKMAAGRKAAAEKKKAEKEGAQHKEVEEEVKEEKPSKGSPAFRAFPFKGKSYLLDSNTNGLWKKQSDGSQGEWVGILSSDRKSIDADASNPYASDE